MSAVDDGGAAFPSQDTEHSFVEHRMGVSSFCFATCDRGRALGFLRKLYPNSTVNDEGPTKALLDLVEADVLRIDDPDCHEPAQVRLGRQFQASGRTQAEMIDVSQAFHDAMLSARLPGSAQRREA